MRMYCANVRARSPVLIFRPATDFDGIETLLRPAAFASAAIAFGVMSGDPTICSLARFERTVSRPLKPVTMEPTPNAIRMIAAPRPPYWKNLDFMPYLLTVTV